MAAVASFPEQDTSCVEKFDSACTTPTNILDMMEKENLSHDESESETEVDLVEEQFRKHSQHLIGIFPAEVWSIILDFITDPEDFRNVCNASLYFRDILLPKRAWLLFPAVWTTLGGKYEEENHEVYSAVALPREYCRSTQRRVSGISASPGKLHLRWYTGILNLRLVCCKWSHAVDNFYNNSNHHYTMEYDVSEKHIEGADPYNVFSKHSKEHWSGQAFYQPGASIVHFLEHFETTHGNDDADRCPLIGRSVSFLSGDHEFFHRMGVIREYDDMDFSENINAFLRKYGHHVWYCTFLVEDDCPSVSHYYNQLQHWLTFLPNVKVLKLSYSSLRLKYGMPERREEIQITLEELCQLQNEVGLRPPPKLRQLELLSTTDILYPIFDALIHQNNHVPMLEAHRECENVIQEYNVGGLRNLRELSFNIVDVPEYAILESLEMDWKLSKIYLDFEWCPYISWGEVFSLLENKWGNTLTNVRLLLPTAERDSERKDVVLGSLKWKLNLPRVKYFAVKLDDFSSLDFILPMRNSLEMLAINTGPDFNEFDGKMLATFVEHQQEIKLLGYFDKLSKSNIWSIFPKLQRIDIMGIHCAGCGLGGLGSVLQTTFRKLVQASSSSKQGKRSNVKSKTTSKNK